MSSENKEYFPQVHMTDIPEEILEHILRHLSPYADLKSSMQVCRQWHRLVLGVIRQLHHNFHQCVQESKVSWTSILPEVGATITERYSHCACYYNKSVYVFGGCTSTNTTFNDLWRFDLNRREWIRPLAMGTYPSPKACASMVVYKDSLVLFGGWSHPTPYPLHQAARFFSELHIYTPLTNRWSHVTTVSQTSPKATAGHSASIVGDTMVVFGGSQLPGAGSNDLWLFDFIDMCWHHKNTTNHKPSPRYGQSQVTVDNNHILIIGGCGGPNQIFHDLWLLCMDTDPWYWVEIKVINPDLAAPQLWCHPACKVGGSVVVLSKPAKPSTSVVVQPTQHVQVSRVWVPPTSDQLQDLPRGPVSQRLNSPGSKRGIFKRPLPDTDDSSSTESSDDGGGGAQQNSPEFKHPGSVLGHPKSPGPLYPPTGPSRINGQQSTSSGAVGPHVNLGNQSGAADAHPADNGEAAGTSSVRPGLPAIRPNAMKNRQKQLEALLKYEEKIKNGPEVLEKGSAGDVCAGPAGQNVCAGRVGLNVCVGRVGLNVTLSGENKRTPGVNIDASPVRPLARDSRSVMHLHVLDLSTVVTENTVTWQPLRDSVAVEAPEETIFYSLVEGRAELIMFGGIQRDIQSMQRGMDIKSHIVSNNLYIISPWQQTV